MQAYDWLFVDEAGQVGLANIVAMARAARNIVLVGDPSQLPPIGPGRPFVDIVELLEPEILAVDEPRIGRGYAELTVGSRQKGKERRDLEFAELFSGRAAGPAQDEIIACVTEGEVGTHLRIFSWSSPAALARRLPKVIGEELGVGLDNLEQSFAVQALGGNASGASA